MGVRSVEGVEKGVFSSIFFHEIFVEVRKFDFDLAPMKLVIIFYFDSLFGLKQRLESLHVRRPFWVVEKWLIGSLRLELDCVGFVEC
jgi:hypothetical protein